jgi:hypothetical protein
VAASGESELIAQELSSPAEKLSGPEKRLDNEERMNGRLESPSRSRR